VLDDVDVLMRFLVDAIPARLPGDRHERRTVEVGIGHAGGEVGRAGPERREAHAGATGEPTAGVGHERRPLLVARRDEADARVGERVEDLDDLFARKAEHVPYAFVLETADDQLGRAHRAHAIHTDFTLTNSRMPYSDSSRP
jgi:hypothetical protein